MLQAENNHNITVSLTTAMMKAFNLDTVFSPDNPYQDPDVENDFNVADKVSHLMQILITLSVSHFPLLSQYEWQLLLNATQPWDPENNSHLMMAAVHPEYPHFLLSKVANECDVEDFEELEESRIASLTPVENLSVLLASERFWTSGPNQPGGLRGILAEISQRPQECVFSDDPAPADLWDVKDISLIDQNTALVEFDYNGAPMASMQFMLSRCRNEIYRGEYVCNADRPLALPGVSLESFLFRKALEPVFAKFKGAYPKAA